MHDWQTCRQIVPLPVGRELFREAIDAFTLLANADTSLMERYKAWLYDDYMH